MKALTKGQRRAREELDRHYADERALFDLLGAIHLVASRLRHVDFDAPPGPGSLDMLAPYRETIEMARSATAKLASATDTMTVAQLWRLISTVEMAEKMEQFDEENRPRLRVMPK